jgi:hypothetical protein
MKIRNLRIKALSYEQCCKLWCSGRFLVLQGVAELADGPVGCGEFTRNWCLFVGNFSVTRLVYLRRRKDGLDET